MKAHLTLDHPPIFPRFSEKNVTPIPNDFRLQNPKAASCGLNVANCRVQTWKRGEGGKNRGDRLTGIKIPWFVTVVEEVYKVGLPSDGTMVYKPHE